MAGQTLLPDEGQGLAGEKVALFGPNGTSLVIHDRPDDYKSQPSGNAGDRIACAVIKK